MGSLSRVLRVVYLVPADVRSKDDVQKVFEEVQSALGRERRQDADRGRSPDSVSEFGVRRLNCLNSFARSLARNL